MHLRMNFSRRRLARTDRIAFFFHPSSCCLSRARPGSSMTPRGVRARRRFASAHVATRAARRGSPLAALVADGSVVRSTVRGLGVCISAPSRSPSSSTSTSGCGTRSCTRACSCTRGGTRGCCTRRRPCPRCGSCGSGIPWGGRGRARVRRSRGRSPREANGRGRRALRARSDSPRAPVVLLDLLVGRGLEDGRALLVVVVLGAHVGVVASRARACE